LAARPGRRSARASSRCLVCRPHLCCGSAFMLNVAALTPARALYHEGQIPAAADDYYSQDGLTLGAWWGEVAAELRLVGERVLPGQVVRMQQGADPGTGRELRRNAKPRSVPVSWVDPESGRVVAGTKELRPVGGWDLAFGAPKSISLAYVLASDDVKRDVIEAHQAAVRAALMILQREACWVRLGAQGRDRHPGSGILAAIFDHALSRRARAADGSLTIDPHLHTHVLVANYTQAPNGAWRALDSQTILRRYKLALGYVYQAVLRDEITRRLGWEFRTPVKGLAELAEWPVAVLREMSQRRRQIELELVGVEGKRWQRAQEAAWATRARKTDRQDPAEFVGDWRARMAEHGMDAAAIERALARCSLAGAKRPLARDEGARIAHHLAGPQGLTETQNTFTRADVLRAFAGDLHDGASLDELTRLAEDFLRSDARRAGRSRSRRR
jgi:conjugative relaxase-like TrwC/TraI family protein